MRVGLFWRGCRRRRARLRANIEQFRELFRIWGLRLRTIDKLYISISFRRLDDIACWGIYCGRRDNVHRIHIRSSLVTKKNKRFLNSVAIHELRHAFWNILHPGQTLCGDCDGDFYTSAAPATRRGKQRENKEERDCLRAEKKYKKFKLLEFY